MAERLRSSVANINKQLRTEFLEVENAKSFFATLEKISERAGKEGLWPILHLEIHGRENGLDRGTSSLDAACFALIDASELTSVVRHQCRVKLVSSLGKLHLSHLLGHLDRTKVWLRVR